MGVEAAMGSVAQQMKQMALTIPPYMAWIVVVLLLAFLVLSPASENPRPNP